MLDGDTELARRFFGGRGGQGDPAALGPMLRALWEGARTAWPGLEVPAPDFAAYLGERARDARELPSLHAIDLYLACGCVRGEKAALAAFEALLPSVRPAILRAGAPAGGVDDVVQQLRRELLVADGGRAPRIADYAGHGALKNWLCAAGARMAIRARQRDEREVPDEARALQDLESVLGDPELDYMKAHYRAEFRLAFREALASLSPRQRNVLRLYVVDGVSSEQIGLLHQVHRGTVAKWLGDSRQLLLQRTRAELARRLGLNDSELESLIVLVRSHLDVSLAGLMKDEPER